jgi:crotonobetainyl-CoA:carnitine CoA-transferase CaiB-like acyl-CoA transferase
MSGYVGVGFEAGGQFNPPLYPLGNADPGNGLNGAVAILMALLHRDRTGEGQRYENPQLNATMLHLAHIVRRSADHEVLNAGRLDPLQYGMHALERLYETADGWVCIVAVTESHLAGLSKVIATDLLSDKRFSSAAARQSHDYELSELISSALRTEPTAAAVAELAHAGVPVAEPVPYNNHAFMQDPENRRTRRVAECPHPTLGHARELALLVRVSDAAMTTHRVAPELGEHTDSILESLGYDRATIAALHERGAARTTAVGEGAPRS